MYERWEFCKAHCETYKKFPNKRERYKRCSVCKAYQMHQYLREQGLILEEGSELVEKISRLEKVAEAAEELSTWLNDNRFMPGSVLLEHLRQALADLEKGASK